MTDVYKCLNCGEPMSSLTPKKYCTPCQVPSQRSVIHKENARIQEILRSKGERGELPWSNAIIEEPKLLTRTKIKK